MWWLVPAPAEPQLMALGDFLSASTSAPRLFHFESAPFLVERNIDVLSLKEPTLIFSGTAREAATGFPANLNVAVSVSLAGVGPDETLLEVWADPTLEHNTHHVQVVSDSALLSMEIQNIPSENPKTGRITAQSVIAMLRKLRAPLSIGT